MARRQRAVQAGWSRSVRARDNDRCVECGSDKDLQAHHKIPVSEGGKYTLANGETLCWSCHDVRHGIERRRVDEPESDQAVAHP